MTISPSLRYLKGVVPTPFHPLAVSEAFQALQDKPRSGENRKNQYVMLEILKGALVFFCQAFSSRIFLSSFLFSYFFVKHSFSWHFWYSISILFLGIFGIAFAFSSRHFLVKLFFSKKVTFPRYLLPVIEYFVHISMTR